MVRRSAGAADLPALPRPRRRRRRPLGLRGLHHRRRRGGRADRPRLHAVLSRATSGRARSPCSASTPTRVGFVAELPRILARQADAARQGDRPGGAPRASSRPTSSSSTSSTATPTLRGSSAAARPGCASSGSPATPREAAVPPVAMWYDDALDASAMSSSFPMRNMRVRFAGETNIGLKRAAQRGQLLPAREPSGSPSSPTAWAVTPRARWPRRWRSRRSPSTSAPPHEDAELTWPYKLDRPDRYDANRLITGIKLANLRIYDKAQRDENCHGMGTTIVAALFLDDKVLIGHVGDSRVYRFRDGQLMQLTEDHSLLNDYIKMKRLSADEVGQVPAQERDRARARHEGVGAGRSVERPAQGRRHLPPVLRRAVGHGRRRRARLHPAGRAGSRRRVRAADPRRQPQRRASTTSPAFWRGSNRCRLRA